MTNEVVDLDYNQFIAVVVRNSVTHVLGVSQDLYESFDQGAIVVKLSGNDAGVKPGWGYNPNDKTFATPPLPQN